MRLRNLGEEGYYGERGTGRAGEGLWGIKVQRAVSAPRLRRDRTTPTNSWTPRESHPSIFLLDTARKSPTSSSWTLRESRPSPMAPAHPARDARAGRRPAFAGARTVALLLLVVIGQVQTREAHEPAVLERWRGHLELCPAGSYLSDTNTCEDCEDGVDYTTYPNHLQACLPCSSCAQEQIVQHPCTRTSDTVCQCKAGTFREEGSPEFCQKCRTSCPDGMVIVSPCTPWSDLKCMDKQSDTKYVILAFVILILVGLLVYFKKTIKLFLQRNILSKWPSALVHCLKSRTPASTERSYPDCGQDSRTGDHIDLSEAPGGSETEDNDHSRISLECSLVFEQETEQGQVATDVTAQTPGEADCLLQESAEAEKSPAGRRQLCPARNVDPTDALRKVFSYCMEYVHHKSWDQFMLHLGLTPNEIHIAKISKPEDPLCEMLHKWLNKTGRRASINTLLDALENIGEKFAVEHIEDKAVKSKEFIYQEH
ncbi:tumor necrosis factor receptor superfamily member 10A isoform X3 [Cavia porcellus]|uniref:tumor necrosis factor receptor superfamily member 10A isoform X3 n=1 Tax=Cavia porcellus TaxID=10141 RepID=UPI0003514462